MRQRHQAAVRAAMAATVVAVSASGLSMGACGGDGDDGAASSITASTSSSTTVESAIEIPDFLPEPGTGVVVIGGVDAVEVEVTACVIDPGAKPDGQVPAQLLSLLATGTDADGVTWTVDASRFRSLGASPTVTDTITVVVGDPEDPDRALVAQRFEVDGLVTDLRDLDADDPLLRIAGSTIEGGGVFAPPGETTGVVEGRLRAVCP